MTSYIITGNDEETRLARVTTICEEHKISPFDITFLHAEKETSLGIELVKKLQAKIFLKPLKSEDKAVIIPHAHLLTIPAQNALLKLLEEPPDHTLIFLVSETIDTFLPTIRSRCTHLKVEGEGLTLSSDEINQLQLLRREWEVNSVPGALKDAEVLAKDKQEALLTLQKAIHSTRIEFLDSLKTDERTDELFSQIQHLLFTFKTLSSTNANVRMTLENLFLNLRKT